jgi:hypothetical protein
LENKFSTARHIPVQRKGIAIPWYTRKRLARLRLMAKFSFSYNIAHPCSTINHAKKLDLLLWLGNYSRSMKEYLFKM